MATNELSKEVGRIRPAVFAELQARIDRLGARGDIELIPLHIGDTYIPPPASAIHALGGLDSEDTALHRYGATTGLAPLRDAVARTLERRGIRVDPTAEVLIGNGGTHALYCAARAVLDAGDEVILASPYWPLAPGVFTACGAVPVEAPLTQRLFDDPSLDPAAVLRTALGPRTKGIYFISPNNPDGKVLSTAQLERIASFSREHDLWVFADEVYADVVYDGVALAFGVAAPAPQSIATFEGMRARTICLHSLSKSHALAGLRVGFVSAPERVVTAGRRVSTHTAFNVSVAMQRVALAALEDEAFPRNARDVYVAARNAVVHALDGAPVRFHVAEGATYLFLDFGPAIGVASKQDGGATPSKKLYAILERAIDRGVLLAPGDAFGSGYETFARLCFTAVPTERVILGVGRLREAIDAYVRGEP